MTKTGHVATITQLEHEINEKTVRNNTVNIVDNDFDRQKCEIVEEDLLNNNEIKCGVLCNTECQLPTQHAEKVATSVGQSLDTASAPTAIEQQQKHRFFGFEFDSKLKWDNIIGIVIIHLLFVYTMLCQKPLPQHFLTYFWGKSKYFFFFLFRTIYCQKSF